MAAWFWYAIVAAVLYGAHQIFTRLASERIGDGLGGFVVEASAAMFILLYLAVLWFGGRWNQKFSIPGFNYSLLTGICVGAGTIAFFLLFQKGGPLSAVPAKSPSTTASSSLPAKPIHVFTPIALSILTPCIVAGWPIENFTIPLFVSPLIPKILFSGSALIEFL